MHSTFSQNKIFMNQNSHVILLHCFGFLKIRMKLDVIILILTLTEHNTDFLKIFFKICSMNLNKKYAKTKLICKLIFILYRFSSLIASWLIEANINRYRCEVHHTLTQPFYNIFGQTLEFNVNILILSNMLNIQEYTHTHQHACTMQGKALWTNP